MAEKTFAENKSEYIETIAHKKIALNQLDSLLTYHIDNNNLKKANLLSYWFEDFAKYNLAEEFFNPKLLKKYKRGSIIKANLGFNVGNEEGGLHYCIVLDKNNALSSGTLTVVPLTSIKENKKYNSSTLNLGNEIYLNLRKICDDMTQKTSTDILANLRVSTNTLDLIDLKIKELFLKS